MKLNFEQIKSIVTGAVQFIQEDDGIHLKRYTPEQEELYENRVTHHLYCKTLNSTGMKLQFKTNARRILLQLLMRSAGVGGLEPCSVDIFVNGELFCYLDVCPGENANTLGEKAVKEILLEDGEKEIYVQFPYRVMTVIQGVEIDDWAYVQPARPTKKLLVFGDSISMGCTVERPSNHYSCRLARALDAEEFNKAMGTERFFPMLAKAKDDFEPDYITVAYGTNDWDFLLREQFLKNCPKFLNNLREVYPNAKIFVITPLWRKDRDEERLSGTFDEIVAYIRETAEKIPNTVVIDGYNLVPHEERYFIDLRLHPNDAGFEHYTKNLLAQILPHCQG